MAPITSPFAPAPSARRTPLPRLLFAAALALGGASSGTAEGACGDGVEPQVGCDGRPVAQDVGSAPAGSRPSTELGNPVSLTTGNKRQHELDLAVPGSHLVFHRHYNSLNADFDGGVGQGWTHSYSVSLLGAGEDGMRIVQSDGRRLRFERTTDGTERGAVGTGDGDAGAARTVRFRAASPSDGYIERLSPSSHRWLLPDGRTLVFQGSYLVGVDWERSATHAHRRLSMYYRKRYLSSVTDESGRVLRFRWTPGRPSALLDYDARPFGPLSGHLAAVTLPDGGEIGFDYDERRNLTRARYPDGTARLYHYEDPSWPNHLTGLTDRTGTRFANWAYDEHGRAVLSEHADGVERVTLVHPDIAVAESGEEVETRVTDSLGAESVYRWRSRDGHETPLLLGSRGPGCTTCPPTGIDYAYDAGGRLASARRTGEGNARGRALVEHVHDEAGRLLERWRTGPDGRRERVERREYAGSDPSPVLIARPSVNPRGERTARVERNARGRMTALVERGFAPFVPVPGDTASSAASVGVDGGAGERFVPLRRVTRFGRDELGRIVSIDGPREDVEDITRLDWDASSRLVAVHPPASPALRFGGFDADGRPTEIRIARARPHRIGYGAHGEVETIEHRGAVTRFERDAEGRLVGLVDADGRRTRIERDAAGRVRSTRGPFGRVVRLVLDTESRELRREFLGIDGQLVRALSIVRDELGRPREHVEETSAGDGAAPVARTTDFEHDEAGHLGAAIGRADGARLGIDTDPFGRVFALTRPDGTTTTFLRDALGRPAGEVDARGNATRELRDDFGALVGTVSPDTGAERLERDAAGHLVRRVREDSGTTRYRRDAAGRPIERRTADGGVTTWTYDEALGRLIDVVSDSATERFAHDDDGQLVRHLREIDGHRFETLYAYDERGRLSLKTLPGGERLRHHYHESGPNAGTLRAIVRERWFGLGGETLVAEIDLDARDGTSGHVAANGLRTDRRYAPDGRLRSLEIGGTLAAGYTFDAEGRLVRIEENGEHHRYAYAGRRLISARTPDVTYRYRYDAAGNRTERRVSDASGAGTFERALYPDPGRGNGLLAVVDGRTGVRRAYEHDAGGSPTRVGELRYAYDAHRRPVSVHRDGALLATYAYNAFGERIRKVVHGSDGPPVVTYFLYDGNALVAEADGDGRVRTEYVYLPGQQPVARLADGEVHAIHTDHRGAPRLASDDEGRIAWQARYTPFGEARVSRERIALPLRLPGQYADAETGTHYNYYRDYDPATGRYLTSDPLGLLAGSNTYAYVGGDPLGAVDPLGLAAVAAAPLTITATSVVTGSALYGWLVAASQAGLATLSAVGAGPALAVVGVAALAVYFYREFGGGPSGEADFTDEFGGKPRQSDYQALRRELGEYAPWLGSPGSQPSYWDGSWSSYFEMARQLEDAQRTFIADYEATYGAGYCPLPDIRARYEGAVAAVAAAEAGAAVVHSAASDEASSPGTNADAEARQREYEYAKNFCDNRQPAPTDNLCATLSAEIEHAEQCAALYEAWDRKWLPGRHDQKIAGWRNRATRKKEEHRRRCTNK